MSENLPAPHVPALFDELTPREQVFVQHPEVMLNATKAAIESGYSESYAKSAAYRLRKQLMFYIRPIAAARFAALDVTRDRVREEMAAIAFANEADFYETEDTPEGPRVVPKNPLRLPEYMQRAIKRITTDVIVTPAGMAITVLTGVELYEKDKALKDLAEILGLKEQRGKDPSDDVRAQTALLEHLTPGELKTVYEMHQLAARRAAGIRERKLDADALPGETVDKTKN